MYSRESWWDICSHQSCRYSSCWRFLKPFYEKFRFKSCFQLLCHLKISSLINLSEFGFKTGFFFSLIYKLYTTLWYSKFLTSSKTSSCVRSSAVWGGPCLHLRAFRRPCFVVTSGSCMTRSICDVKCTNFSRNWKKSWTINYWILNNPSYFL